MKKHLLVLCSLAAATFVVAQEPTPTAKPVKLCVAQLRNQTLTKFEMPKLQKSYLEDLQSTKLVKDHVVVFVTVQADNPDDAKLEIQQSECEYAIYTRILRKPKEESVSALDGVTYRVSEPDTAPAEIYGLQCTVEKTSSGMPILIDRHFDSQATKGDKGVLKLLAGEATRVEDALNKKLPK